MKTYCGAETRAGTPCKRSPLAGKRRCRLHGGLSTGPRSIEGKAKSAANGLMPKRKRTP
ncbi:HGGxSTG domain-containing protein [Burkholderia sp. Bp9099]|uniref:HGGxSTG domain-containing protein n=1 Tax=Burkholderia sp. Bp9099 TaxID=2184568 RepID=UPI002892EA92|nr:HGGxSTG domain-containing protein [Burkholderia sp. Bp9099]